MTAKADALILDLDGVVIDSSASYRRAYLLGVDAWLRESLGWEVCLGPGRASTLDLADVHALKQYPGFNAPIDVVTTLGTYLICCGLAARSVGPDVPGLRSLLPQLSEAAKTDGGWPGALRAKLLPDRAGEALSLLDAEGVLRVCREFYGGDGDCMKIYGYESERGRGLHHEDRWLVEPRCEPLGIPVAVFTGRDEGEAQWVVQRHGLFRDMNPMHFWHRGRGVRKPDPAAFGRCLQRLGAEAPLYVGDLRADAELVFRYRREIGEYSVGLGLVGSEAASDLADIHYDNLAALTASLGHPITCG